jgi:limonene-1,2-epoxide hydrolase
MSVATANMDNAGPLSRLVEKFSAQMEIRAMAKGCTLEDWTPLSEFVAVDQFERVGAYMEVMTWDEYIRFLTQWAGSTRFEMTLKRVTEVGRLVFQEIEERHYKGEEFIRKNVIAVYEFDARDKIKHLDIYEQAKDSGRWIIDAAQASAKPA